MKSYHNIEKHPMHRGVYLGYTAEGFARRIQRSTSSFGNWVALPHPGEGVRARNVYAFRLDDMSKQLEEVKGENTTEYRS